MVAYTHMNSLLGPRLSLRSPRHHHLKKTQPNGILMRVCIYIYIIYIYIYIHIYMVTYAHMNSLFASRLSLRPRQNHRKSKPNGI